MEEQKKKYNHINELRKELDENKNIEIKDKIIIGSWMEAAYKVGKDSQNKDYVNIKKGERKGMSEMGIKVSDYVEGKQEGGK